MALGADLCCDSAHKTLPVLTGGGYLHVSETAPGFFMEQAANALSLFASTSPSYLILQSLDRANLYLAEGYSESLENFCQQVHKLKKRLIQRGYTLLGDEPLKITIAPKSYGYTGIQLAEILQKQGLVFHSPQEFYPRANRICSKRQRWQKGTALVYYHTFVIQKYFPRNV